MFLQFDGVNNAFYVWMNGQPVGYSQDSCLPAEFDVTRFLQPGRNLVSVQASLDPPSSARHCVSVLMIICQRTVLLQSVRASVVNCRSLVAKASEEGIDEVIC